MLLGDHILCVVSGVQPAEWIRTTVFVHDDVQASPSSNPLRGLMKLCIKLSLSYIDEGSLQMYDWPFQQLFDRFILHLYPSLIKRSFRTGGLKFTKFVRTHYSYLWSAKGACLISNLEIFNNIFNITICVKKNRTTMHFVCRAVQWGAKFEYTIKVYCPLAIPSPPPSSLSSSAVCGMLLVN